MIGHLTLLAVSRSAFNYTIKISVRKIDGLLMNAVWDVKKIL